MGSESLALIDGEVVTMEPSPARAEAILIEGEKIVAVGSTQEILNRAPAKTRLIHLAGRVATPGFIDSHTHLVSYGLDLSRPDLSTARSFNEVLEMVRGALRNREPSKPLIAVNWDQSKWRDPHIPTAEELDRATGRYPVILRRICGHIAVANGAALELLPRRLRKVDWRKGLLFEDAALDLNRVFPPDAEEIVGGLLKAMDAASRVGVTSIHDVGSLRYYRAYKRLEKERRLKLRVYFCFKHKEIDKLLKSKIHEGSRSKWLTVGGIKIFADGSLGARTAALSRPYVASSNVGVLNHTSAKLLKIMRKADKHGFQLFIHAIGDRAIEQVLSAYGNLIAHGNPLRHRIEHFEIASRGQIEKLRRLNLIACMQPNFVTWQRPKGIYEWNLGVRRRKMANRIADVIRAGAVVAFGSDCMPFSPSYGLWGATEHPNPEQRISTEKALKTYTLNSAYASFDEKIKGSLVPGKLADLVVFSENPFESKDLRKVEVLLTIVNGKIVYSDPRRSINVREKS